MHRVLSWAARRRAQGTSYQEKLVTKIDDNFVEQYGEPAADDAQLFLATTLSVAEKLHRALPDERSTQPRALHAAQVHEHVCDPGAQQLFLTKPSSAQRLRGDRRAPGDLG